MPNKRLRPGRTLAIAAIAVAALTVATATPAPAATTAGLKKRIGLVSLLDAPKVSLL